jgi:hypothetical protein
MVEIGTIANNDIYQINYSSTPGKFSENLLTVQHMINSLKIGRPHSVPDLIKSGTGPTSLTVYSPGLIVTSTQFLGGSSTPSN